MSNETKQRAVADRATNIQELRDQLHYFQSLATVSQEELVKAIEDAIDAFRRVNTTNSLALLAIIEPQFAEARKQFGRVDRLAALKAIAMWAGQVKVGWL